MNFEFPKFVDQLRVALDGPRPSKEEIYRLAPTKRTPSYLENLDTSDYRQSAVIMLWYPVNGIAHTAFMLRNTYKGVHSGQISLPGGRREEEDHSLEYTALRELEEEFGVSSKALNVVGKLSEVIIPPSKFKVYPYVAVLEERPIFNPDPREVAQLIEAPLSWLLNDDHLIMSQQKVANGMSIQTPAFVLDQHQIWGATAIIIGELKWMLKQL